MVNTDEFYHGSRVFIQLADLVSLPIDQFNFLVCQLVALCLAFLFRACCTAENVGATTRHMIEAGVGVLLCLFCFGYQIWHLVAQSLVCYIMMACGGHRFSHTLVFAFSMIYLSVCHIYRQIYDYGCYTMDITGPLMIQTQKVTSLAFSLHDGRFKGWSSLTQEQKDQAVRKLPTILDYLSYIFYFHGIMVGPLTFYNDYIAFINGTCFSKPLPPYPGMIRKHPADGLNKIVFRKLAIASVFCLSMMTLPSMYYPSEKLKSPEFYSMPFVDRLIYIMCVMTLAKHKYYFAWLLGDAINNAAGIGFSGYDNQGNAVWELTNNVNIIGVEFATSLKTNIESWNIKTMLWLRRVVYERVPYHNTLAVFACSAFWHGFYPGYYITFGSGALMTMAARQVRRRVRPMFQETRSRFYTYEAITFIATRLANCYIMFPFLMLEFYVCLNIYMSLYFYYHIIAILALLYFNFVQEKLARREIADHSTIDQVNELSQLQQSERKSSWGSESSDMNDDSQELYNITKDIDSMLDEEMFDSSIQRSLSFPGITLQARPTGLPTARSFQ